MFVAPEKDPNAEPCHWLEVEEAKRTVYCQRFSLLDGVVADDMQREKKVYYDRCSSVSANKYSCQQSSLESCEIGALSSKEPTSALLSFYVCIYMCIQPLKEVVKEALMTFLKSQNAPFTLPSLSSSEEVMGAVWESVKQGEGVEEEKSESERKEMVKRELNTLLKRLPTLGLVLPVNSTPLKLEVEYEVCNCCVFKWLCYDLYHSVT